MLALANVAAYNAPAPLGGNPQSALAGLPALGLDLHKTKNVLKVPFGFALQSAVGTYFLVDDVGNPALLPAKAIIQRSYLDVYTSYTGASALVGFGYTGAANAILAQTAVASLAAGLVEGIQVGTMATAVKNAATTPVQISASISGAVLTAGASNLFLEYVIGT